MVQAGLRPRRSRTDSGQFPQPSRGLLDAIPESVVIGGADRTVVYANRAAERLYGCGQAELCGRPFESLLGAEYRDQYRRQHAVLFAAGASQIDSGRLELRSVTLNGASVLVELDLTPIEHDGTRLLVHTLRPVTDAKLRERENEALLAATATLGAQAEPEAVLRTLVEQAVSLLEAERAHYAVPWEGRIVIRGRWHDGHWVDDDHEPRRTGVLASVWESGRPFRSNDVASEPRADRAKIEERKIQSQLSVPILARSGQTLGFISFQNSRRPEGFSERDERLMMAFCETGAAILRRARETAARLEAEHAAAKREREVAALLTVAERLNAAAEPEQVLQGVLAAAAEVLAVRRVAIVSNEGDHALRRYDWNGGVWAPADQRLPLDGSFPGWVISHAQPYRSADVANDPNAYQPLRDRFGSNSVLAVPLFARNGHVVGALSLFDRLDGNHFSDDDQRLAEGIAHYASEALERARLAEALRQLNEQLEQRVATRTAELQAEAQERSRLAAELRQLNEGLEQRVATRTSELEAANHELESFSYSVSHDLRAPLRSLDGFSRILIEDFAGELSETPRHYLEIVRSSAQQMGRLVDDLLAFSRLGRQSLKKQPVDVTVLVRQVIESLQLEQGDRRAQFVVGDLPVWQADLSLLRQVFVNLIGNSLKFTRHRDPAVIEIGCRHESSASGEVICFVRDNGAGFDMQYADKLFGVFQRLHRAEDYEGTGVGLAIVERIVHRHGGRVWAEAEVDKGATFYVALEGETTHE